MQPPRFDEICEFGNLLRAAKRALKSRWRYRQEAAHFRVNCEHELLQLKQEVLDHTYRPLPYRTFVVHDPKQRTIAAAPMRDRVVHHALIQVIGPWLEHSFIEHSYACRVGKGTHKAIAKAQQFAGRYGYYVHLDVVKFFDSIDHGILQKLLCQKIEDASIMWLLATIIAHSAPGMPEGKSVPIGNLTSQYFGNLYPDSLDHFVKDQCGLKGYLRYMDDMLLCHQDKGKLGELADRVRDFVATELQLRLAPAFVQPMLGGIPFLGMRIFHDRLRLQRASWQRFRRKFTEKRQQFQQGEIDEERFLRSMQALVSHLDHADTYHLRGRFFDQDFSIF